MRRIVPESYVRTSGSPDAQSRWEVTFKDLIQDKPGPVRTPPGVPRDCHREKKGAPRGSQQSPWKKLRAPHDPNETGVDISPAAIAAGRWRSRAILVGPGPPPT